MALDTAYGEHLGMQVMQERMMVIGGHLTIKNSDTGGVIVKASLTGGEAA